MSRRGNSIDHRPAFRPPKRTMHRNFVLVIFITGHLVNAQQGYDAPNGAPSAHMIVPSKAVQSNTIVVNNPYEQQLENILTPPPQTPSPPKVSNCLISDILFVLDATGSVREVYDAQKKYILDIASQLDISSTAQHVGILQYSSKRRQKIYVNLDEAPEKDRFLAKVSALPYYNGVTATGAALELADKALQKRRPDLRSVVVVLTDGFSYDRVEEPAKRLNELPNNMVYVAGLAMPFAQMELDKIAGDPSRVLLGNEKKSELLSKLKC